MANNNFTFEVSKETERRLNKALKQLAKVDEGAIVVKSLKEGSEIFVKEGKKNYNAYKIGKHYVKEEGASRGYWKNKTTGKLRRSFTTRTNKKKAMGQAGFKKPAGAVAHLIDRGTNERKTRRLHYVPALKRMVQYTGSVRKGAPNTGWPFWTDAVQDNGDKALNKVIDAVYEQIDKIMKSN